ncbi:MAG: aminotransferase class I/II-fold pyridoxal phosphate-dependent enzyme [Candidatus Omnitrophica bacterium]|nr:aminotransferase class I/II-fold pyridoxal phosphate-dependent enzyme [Candidatus Omnitrophota bacterium]MBU4478031.1 aminotransferase class I/II-fold pyridoxal phosphate-dependent enzyme [Candidatus Omnitrophota bacterium]MCG2703639.1 aminotransferase class I/II-fold pyridoxal phosphate-dependent enzyme [Candidatus Omnitrophota bacterium]
MMINKISRGCVLFSAAFLKVFLVALFSSEKKRIELPRRFEEAFARYVGTRHAIAVSSGTMALSLCLQALGGQEGDEILVPGYTVTEVIDVILLYKMRPVFIDVRIEDGTIDPVYLERMISARAKFVLMTHIHGCPCDIAAIETICKKHNLIIIEDSAQSCGAEYKGKKTGRFGRVGYFSFGIMKNINTLGGGMIVTDDAQLAWRIRDITGGFKRLARKELWLRLAKTMSLSFFTHPVVFSLLVYPLMYLLGEKRERIFEFLFKAPLLSAEKLDKLKTVFSAEQAALGLFQLRSLDVFNKAKMENAELLESCLADCLKVQCIKKRNGRKNIYLNFVVLAQDREKLINRLFLQGIDVSPGFVMACSDIERFKGFRLDCPNSLSWQEKNIYIPIYPFLSRTKIIKMADIIKKFYEEK